MRLTTLDRELARLAPTPDPRALDAARTRVMAEVADGRHGAAADAIPTDTPTDADVLPLPRRSTRSRRVAFRLGIAASLAAASVAGITLWPDASASWVPAAYAGWRAVPEPVTPVDAQAPARECLALVAALGARGDTSFTALPLADMTPVVAERRGTWTYLLLVAGERGSHADASLTCLLPDDRRKGLSLAGAAGSSASAPAADQIQWIGAGGGGATFDIYGWVGDDVSRVTATLWNGVVVDATVSDGYFAAWWPVPAGGAAADPITLTWYLTDGTQGGTYDWTTP